VCAILYSETAAGTGTDPAPDPALKICKNQLEGTGAGSVPVPATVIFPHTF
jgi:hypothetical protein